MKLTINTKNKNLVSIEDVPVGHFFKHQEGAIGFVGSSDGHKDNRRPMWFSNGSTLTGWPCSNLLLLVEDLGPVKITLEI